MASTFHKISGKCMWAKVSPPGDEKYEQYCITLALDKDSLKLVKNWKLKNTLRIDDDGQAWMQFSRKFRKEIKGEMVEFGMPKLYDKDEKEYGDDRPFIGNGSDVTIKVVVYTTSMGNGARLEAVRIDKLVEYTPTKGDPVDGIPF